MKIQKLQSLQHLTVSELDLNKGDDPLIIKKQKQRFTELASVLFFLKESCSIDVDLVDYYKRIFQEYLPDNLKH